MRPLPLTLVDLLEQATVPRIVVLVGTPGSGKTTLRRRMVVCGLSPELVVSLDDFRRAARADDVAAGRPPRPLQTYSAAAVRRAARRCDALAAFGAGYLADATHLRRKERRLHIASAEDTGMQCVAVLTPMLTEDELVARNSGRPLDEQVPVDVLLQQQHRRSLLSADRLLEDGFAAVVEL